MPEEPGIGILLYTQQPIVAIGLRSVLNSSGRFRFAGCCDNLAATVNYLEAEAPDILLVHLTPRTSLGELAQLRSAATRSSMVLWGEAIGGEFAFHAMQLGVRAILPGHTSVDGLLTSLANVRAGVLCFEKGFVDKVMLQKRITLTRRQGQIVSLVAQGLKNKAIASTLGITEGTVKLYIYKLFRKLGVNDRLQMALYGLANACVGPLGTEGTAPGAGETVPRMTDLFSPRSLPAQSRGTGASNRVH